MAHYEQPHGLRLTTPVYNIAGEIEFSGDIGLSSPVLQGTG